MKKRYLLAVLFLIVLGVLWGLLPKKLQRTLEKEVVTNSSSLSEDESVIDTNIQTQTPVLNNSRRHSESTNIVDGVTIPPEVVDYVKKSTDDPQYDWRQPINFYGKVVDENNQPVAGASVDFKWTDLSSNGTSEYHTTSDSSGLFSMVNQRGKRLSVTASKSGYYSAADARIASFEYANPADGLFTPDANNPIVFHLRKKGTGVDLITSQYGVKKYVGVSAPLDGTPVKVDLLTRKSGGQEGQLVLRQIKPISDKWKQATEWSFQMEIPEGGFISQNDEFPFEAPESGYEPEVRFDFQQGQTNWAIGLEKDFFIKFGSPARYGRLHVHTLIDMQGARFTYAINPSGLRTLEPK